MYLNIYIYIYIYIYREYGDRERERDRQTDRLTFNEGLANNVEDGLVVGFDPQQFDDRHDVVHVHPRLALHARQGEARPDLLVRMREREMFYLTTHSTHFIYGYMASDIWLRTILIVRKETRCRHICYSFRLAARVILCAASHRQDNTYHGLCYTRRGALAGTRNSSMGPPP